MKKESGTCMKQFQESDICRIFYRCHRIPSGIFNADHDLQYLYSGFGERQTRMYLKDTRQLLEEEHIPQRGYLEYDAHGSLWCVIRKDDLTVFFGPVQTGENPSFSYEGIPEHTRQSFLEIAKCLNELILGEGVPMIEKQNSFRQKQIAQIMYEEEEESALQSFDEIFECVRTGDISELNRRMASGEYLAYMNRIMHDTESGRDIYTFNLAKTYHTALEASVPIRELTPLLDLYIRERGTYTSLAALKSGMQRMIYDFAKYVHQYSENYDSSFVNMTLMYIREHIFEEIRVQEIADHCMMSLSSLQHRFKEETGESLSERILSMKMEKACYFLKNTSISCGEIAYKMGYGSQSYFIRQFKKANKVTPLQYRANGSARGRKG